MSNPAPMKPERIERDDETTLDHPAFAVVSVTRVRGGSFTLFGSPAKVNSAIEINVSAAQGIAAGLSERVHGRNTILSVQMSETQWATLVSSLNVGNGVPSTLTYGPPKDTPLVRYPEIERESDAEMRARAIDKAMKENLDKAMRALERLTSVAETKGSVSKTELKQAVFDLKVALNNAPANFKYAADQITEHMDKVASTVKLDLNAHAMALGFEPDNGLLIEEKGG